MALRRRKPAHGLGPTGQIRVLLDPASGAFPDKPDFRHALT